MLIAAACDWGAGVHLTGRRDSLENQLIVFKDVK